MNNNSQQWQSNPSIGQFEIVKIGLANFPSLSMTSPGTGNFSSGEALTTIAHNLGFTPAFLAYLYIGNNNYATPKLFFTGTGAANAQWDCYQAYADINNLYLTTDTMVYNKAGTAGGTTFKCKYYLLKERVVH